MIESIKFIEELTPRQRLLRLADELENPLNYENFEWEFGTELEELHSEKKCGYQGCAMGMAALKGLVRFEENYDQVDEAEAMKAFNVSQETFDALFGYRSDSMEHTYGCSYNQVTPNMVAAKIREYVADVDNHESGEPTLL